MVGWLPPAAPLAIRTLLTPTSQLDPWFQPSSSTLPPSHSSQSPLDLVTFSHQPILEQLSMSCQMKTNSTEIEHTRWRRQASSTSRKARM